MYPPGMDEEHYARVDKLRDKLRSAEAQVDEIRTEFHSAIRDAFPETHGQPTKRGVLAEVSRRSGYSREHVAQIRDGKATVQ